MNVHWNAPCRSRTGAARRARAREPQRARSTRSGVGDGVGGLGQHGRGPADQAGSELGHRDPGVRAQGDEHGGRLSEAMRNGCPHTSYTGTVARAPRSCSSPPRAATARAWIARCRPSSGRSSSTARPSTCARRSSTTSTSWSSCASAARSSWTSSTTDPGGRGHHLLRPRRLAGGARRRAAARPADHRRDLPARHQGPPRGAEVRRRGLHDRADRPRRPRGGRGHDGRGARAHRAGGDRGRRRRARGRRPRARRLHLADHALGGRDARDHRPPAREASRTSPARARTTSATRRRTASSPSSRWRRSATWCSSSARRTPRTRSASSTSRATSAPERT